MPYNIPYPKAVRVKGTLRCPTCNEVLRPKQWKSNCCKSAYRQYWNAVKKKGKDHA